MVAALVIAGFACIAAGPIQIPAVPVVAAAPTAKDTEEARKYFQAAQKLYKAKQYSEAVAKFEEAYRLKPHPVIHYNIGKCYEQLGDLPKALRYFRDYLRLVPNATDREAVNDGIANLERRLKEKGVQQIMIFTDPANARIEVDGKDLGTSPASAELIGGNHRVTAKLNGFEPIDRSFVMSATKSMELTLVLKPEVAKTPEIAAVTPPPTVTVPPPADKPADKPIDKPADKPTDKPSVDKPKDLAAVKTGPTALSSPGVVATAPAKSSGRLWTYVAAGVAGAGLAAGAGFGLSAQGASNELVTNLHGKEEANKLVGQAQGMATGANVAFGCAAAAGVTAVILYFVEGKAPKATATTGAAAAPAAAFTF